MKHEPEDLKTAASHRGVDHADYRETSDVTKVHAAILREHGEPTSAAVPVPLWLMTLSGVVIIWAGAYLGMFNGGFRGDVFNERDTSPKLLFPDKVAGPGGPGQGVATADDPIASGKKAFSANCVSCHQGNGMGIPGQYPPLVKSEYVTGGSKRLVMILLKGIQGKIKVEGVEYNGAMPAWEKTLTDKKIAQILTYIRQDWGNQAGPISPDQVAAGRKEFAARAEPFTEADLLAVPADADVGAAAPEGAAPAPGPKQ
jgi:mono/diheme cytochrome c family protein